MQKILSTVKYNKTVFLYAASRTLERAAFYGMRGIMLLYITQGLFVPNTEAFQVYGWMIKGLVIAAVIGGVFGDFVLGNRRALLVGSMILCIGFFVLCIPGKEVFYSGIGLIILGSGFYTPNLMARYGKQFYATPELTDGGFSILYALVNVGAFMGTMAIGLITYSNNNYVLGFVLCGVFMVCSTLLSFLTKDTATDEAKPPFTVSASHRALILLVTLLALGLYWFLYDTSSQSMAFLQMKIQETNLEIPTVFWMNLSSGLSIILGIIIAVVYSFYYCSRAVKLAIGFLFTAAALLVLLLPAETSQSAVAIMFLATVLISLAEMVLAPVVYGMVTQRTNPKYLGLLMGLCFVPYALFSFLFPLLIGEIDGTDPMTLMVTAPLIALMGIAVLGVWFVKRKSK